MKESYSRTVFVHKVVEQSYPLLQLLLLLFHLLLPLCVPHLQTHLTHTIYIICIYKLYHINHYNHYTLLVYTTRQQKTQQQQSQGRWFLLATLGGTSRESTNTFVCALDRCSTKQATEAAQLTEVISAIHKASVMNTCMYCMNWVTIWLFAA